MTVRPAYMCALLASVYPALWAAFLTTGDWRLLPLVIWLVACLGAVTYGKENTDVR
jgi:hypothetical protein